MDIKQTLQSKFDQVNDAFFEKAANMLFLRIELSVKTLDEVTELSRKISDYLDQNEPTEKEYYLDIYSSGTDVSIKLESLTNYLDKNILVTLKNPIKSKMDFEGKLIAVEATKITIRWNAKGQFRKQEIELTNIVSANIAAKF